MGFSRRKPYQYPKDSHFTFMRRRVRWMRDFLTKESLFEKPYLSVGRPEMHMEIPSFVFPQFPPYPEYAPFPEIKYPPPYDRYVPRVWSYPPLPTKEGQQPTGSVSTFPTQKRTEQWPSPTSSVPPGNSWTGFRIVPYCDVDYRLSDCAEEGDVFTIRAQAQYYSDSLKWNAVSSNPGEVGVFLVSANMGEATFSVVVLKEITEEVSICIMLSMYDHSFRKTFKLDCGCIEIESCIVCPADPTISWDDDGSIETLARNASGTVAVLGGKGPYSWSVSGTGFTLDNATTTGKSNGLNADGTACGTATITVTDACGEVTIGYVRGTTGQWVFYVADKTVHMLGSGTKLGGCPGTYSNWWEVIQGERKHEICIGTSSYWSYACNRARNCSNAGNTGQPCSESCSDECGSGSLIYGGRECEQLVTNFYSTDFPINVDAWNCWGDNICPSGNYEKIACFCNSDVRNYLWEC